MIQKKFIFCLFIFFFLKGYSQIIPPNPTVPSANLGKEHIEVSNNYFTGSLNVSIPVYNYDFEGISFPIILNYNDGNGVKPDELPSWVGLGWSLQAGGYVHRTVRGKPDEALDYQTNIYTYSNTTLNPSPKKETILSSTDFSYFSNVSKLNVANWYSQSYANSQSPSQTNYPYPPADLGGGVGSITVSNHHPNYDLVPDEFTFSIGNISGKFYLNHLNKWVVEANNGKTYNINVVTGEQVLVDYSVPQTGGRVFYKTPRIIKYLTLTSNDGIKYYFGNSDINAPIDQQFFEYSHSSTVLPTNLNDIHPAYQYVSGNQSATFADIVPHTWYLTKVENLVTGSIITLAYKLQGLQFYKTKQAWGDGGTSITPGALVYTNQQRIYPNPYDWSNYYYASAISRVLTRGYALTSINFPNGIKLEFNSSPSSQLSTNESISSYSENSGFYNYEDTYFNTAGGGFNVPNTLLKLDNILISSGNTIKKEVDFVYSNSNSQRLQLSSMKNKSVENIYTNEYKFNYNNSIQLPPYASGKLDHWGFYNNKDFFSTTPQNNYAYLATYSSYKDPDPSYSSAEILNKITYPTGGAVVFQYEANTYSKQKEPNSFSISSLASNQIGGGVRVNKISYYTNDNQLSYEKNIDYNVPGSSLSSGVLAIPKPQYLSGNVSYYDFRSDGFNPVYYDGSCVTYTYATERQTGNGKTQYEYTNYDNGFNDELPIENNNDSWYFAFQYAYKHNAFKRGKLIDEKIYNEQGTMVHESDFHYEHENSEATKDEVRSLYLSIFAAPNNHYASVSERIYPDNLISTETKSYENNGVISEKNTTSFDSYGNIKELKSYNSIGKVTRQKFKYCYEYSSTGTDNVSLGIKYLNDHGIKNAVIEKITYSENIDGSNSNVISSTIYTYKTQSPFLDKSYSLLTSAPISSSSFNESSNSGGIFLMDSRYSLISDVQMDNYDVKGNPLQITPRNGVKESFLWDYGFTYNTAKIQNALYADVAYTSFEADGSGNWGFGTNAIITNHGSITGEKAYDLVGGMWKNDLDPAKTYILSFWAKAGTPGVNFNHSGGGSDIVLYDGMPPQKTVGDWSYFELTVNNAIGVGIWKWGHIANTYIDEVRLYPYNAQMTTYTYDPTIGMTSECDPNSKITYYKYDAFGRLFLIQDQDKKILKKYCYNYAGQQEQCNFYESAPIDADYYSQSCSSGETPVAYHVSVPQGMFTSSADQLTADQLAQQYAQNQANQYGTCQILNVSVYCENDYGTDITIQMHNVASGVDYWFTAYANNSDILGDVPPGNYDITITPVISGGWWYSYSVGCGYWQDGTGAITFYGVDINSACNTIITE